MFSLFFKIITIALMLTLGVNAFAAGSQDQAGTKTWWDDNKRGWFWYEDPPPEPEEEQLTESTLPDRPTFRNFTYEEVWNMHPEQFQKTYDNTLHAAVQTPTVDNVRDWYQMQDIARRKSLQFANVAQYVVQTTPELNYQKDSPLAAPGRKVLYQQQSQDTEKIIKRGIDSHGLLFFYSSTCPYCSEQAKILQYFSEKYRWEIRPVNIGGEPEIAAQFGVETVPTVLLVNRDVPQPFPVAVGVTTMHEMEKNISRGMRLLDGSLNPSEFSLYEFQRGSAMDSSQLVPDRKP